MSSAAFALSLLLPILSFSTGVNTPKVSPIPAGVPVTEPAPEVRPIKETRRVTVTAYTSLAALTDSSPFITASGSTTRFGTVAINGLPFGTEVRLPDYFGDHIFVVEDRMHKKYQGTRVDVWLPTYQEAKQFGVRHLTLEIL